MPEYENPLLVEAWIAFDFEPNPEKVSERTKVSEQTKVSGVFVWYG